MNEFFINKKEKLQKLVNYYRKSHLQKVLKESIVKLHKRSIKMHSYLYITKILQLQLKEHTNYKYIVW